MLSFKGTRSTLILLLLLVAFVHAQEEEAEKGRGGGGGGSRGSSGRKPTKTVKIGKWNAPLWAVILIPIFVALSVYGWCHACYKRRSKGKKSKREMNPSNLEAQQHQNVPVSQPQYPQFFVFELPPAAPYQTQGSYEKPVGGEAEKFYTQQPALPTPPAQPYNAYNPHGMGYPVHGQEYNNNNNAPVGYPMGGQR
ncbi:hypothetical protein CPB86DRAFT_868876 [Serendipita vermifera]|nr:hypothetical protein CPB86DRAFT_868876 [Serendipita vermifera]